MKMAIWTPINGPYHKPINNDLDPDRYIDRPQPDPGVTCTPPQGHHLV